MSSVCHHETRRERLRCPSCGDELVVRRTVRLPLLLMGAFFAGRVVRVIHQRPLPPQHELWAWAAGATARLLAAVVVMTVVHEAGHVLAVLVQRLRLRGVRLGVGPRLLRLGGLDMRLLLWGGGLTRYLPAGRRQSAVVVAAGPAANAAQLLAALLWWPGSWRPYVVAAAGLGVANLLPFRVAGHRHSDGAQLLRLARLRPARVTRPRDRLGAPAQPAAAGLSPHAVAAALASAGRHAEADEVLRAAGLA